GARGASVASTWLRTDARIRADMSRPAAAVPLVLRADPLGFFGEFGGRVVPETLVPALGPLAAEDAIARRDPEFRKRLRELLSDFVGRPTPLTLAARLGEHAGGARIVLKREDLAHTGAHKINNTVGQALLAVRMAKRRVIAETGAGQHGV